MTKDRSAAPESDVPGLEDFFAAERAQAGDPSPALMRAILADAEQQLARTRPKPGTAGGLRAIWRDILREFGGWRGGAALSACLLLGLMLGYSWPDSLGDLADNIMEFSGASQAGSGDYPLDDLITEG